MIYPDQKGEGTSSVDDVSEDEEDFDDIPF
jgi:hypothetical protein